MKKVILLAAAVLLLSSCSVSIPPMSPSSSRIEGFPGPEDMVLDPYSGQRMIVSSTNRRIRPMSAATGDLMYFTLEDEKARTFERVGEPFDFPLQPHGIDLVLEETDGAGSVLDDSGRQGVPVLYVINHGRPLENGTTISSILCYVVQGGELHFREEIIDPLLPSPNDLVAMPDGTLYVGNDSAGNSMADFMFGLKRSTIVMKKPNGPWQVVAGKLGSICGIAVVGDFLLASGYGENSVYRFTIQEDGTLAEKTVLLKVNGPDNIIVHNGYWVTVASHPSIMKFMQHAMNEENPAPSRVYLLNAETGESRLLAEDNGTTISACSVAVPAGNDLYMGQIMDPFVLKIENVFLTDD